MPTTTETGQSEDRGVGAIPDGYVLVPRIATPEMLEAFWLASGESRAMRERTELTAARRYAAMLAAAPQPGPDAREDGQGVEGSGRHTDGSGHSRAEPSGLLAPRSDRPLSAAPGGERETLRKALTEITDAADKLILTLPAHWHDEATIDLTDAAADARTVLSAAAQDDLYALAQTPALRSGEALERIRHVKSGGVYEVLCADAQVQTDTPLGDYAKVSVYRGVEPPHLIWVRPVDEMEDGRFEPVAPPTAPAAEEAQR